MWSEYLRTIAAQAIAVDRSSSSPARRCSMTSVPRVALLDRLDGELALRPSHSQRTPCSAGSPARRVTTVTRSATMNDE